MGISTTALVALGVLGAGTVAYTMDQSRKQEHAQEDAIKAQNAQLTTALNDNPQPVMPTPTDSNVQVAKQASIAEQVARRGRASTILTQPSEKLGS